MRKPKILLYDLEVSPNLGYAYGTYKTNLLKIINYATIMSVSWKWLGDSKVHHESLVSIITKNDETPQYKIAELVCRLFDEADIVVAHNAYRFDNAVSGAAWIRHGLKPPSPYKTVDTLRVARQFKFPSGNSLNGLGEYLKIGKKSDVKIGELWFDCLQGDMRAWNLLKKYNNQDVILLEAVYKKLLPYTRNHPNIGDITQMDHVCPKCGSTHLQKRGTIKKRHGIYQRYRCNDCGGWSGATHKHNPEGRLVNA